MSDRLAFRIGGYALILAVMASVAAMSAAGLYGWATGTLGWSSWHAAMVPVSLDVAATACACLALDSVRRGDPALLFRALMVTLVALSAGLNYAQATGPTERAFFPVMSLCALGLVEACFRKHQRDQLGGRVVRSALVSPLPRFGLLAWLSHPHSAWSATSATLAERIPVTPKRAPVTVRSELDTMTTAAERIRYAIQVTGSTAPPDVVSWLAEAGHSVTIENVRTVTRRSLALQNGRDHDS